ncbi:unnamed protein product [Eruca vesicaria subsp. sativa]|uniref:NADH dehydrogenase subunit 4 n=1 Tax=Eruca vesicaria subsp. sativa TaxID=29727 RepID=A0ABC8L9N4_ERUVS|nr:unnamed protein product [Eruca vesicaria subsp. sativa]
MSHSSKDKWHSGWLFAKLLMWPGLIIFPFLLPSSIIELYEAQSFVVALLAIVIATFSTGVDSQCFQFRKDENQEEDAIPYGYGFFHFVFATEQCTLQCYLLVGTFIIP